MSASRFLSIVFLILLLLSTGLSVEQTHPELKDLARRSLAQISGELQVGGLRAEVEVLRDPWGVPHIYASNIDDLFFAQGFTAAQDRLWQMEMWRRTKQGRLAEILGPRAFERDRIARLLLYRGAADDAEWTSYHPEARRILLAFTQGINTYIELHKNNLPVEFQLTGIVPERWTPETPTLRSTTFGDAVGEIQLARLVAAVGPSEANRSAGPDPWAELRVPQGLDVSMIGEDVLRSMRAGGGSLPRPPILDRFRSIVRSAGAAADETIREPGSNNWVISGALSATGKPVLANDPHREVTLPSLRYLVHLNAPGWHVIGSGEPALPGVAIGHNERIAWGLTIVGTDQHDVYVEELNPDNPNQVRWNGSWEDMRIIREKIPVRGEFPREVVLKYSRHGPVFHEDSKNHRAYALRSALDEPGTAAYLGSLRLNQTADCREFLAQVDYWKAPSENMICGDVDGNISWQASALTPRRRGWLGRLPVPGNGSFEWDGFREDLPQEFNPARGFIATANNNIHPHNYWPPLMFKTAAAARRITRILELLTSVRSLSLEDHRRIQLDAYSSQAAEDLPSFRGWTAADPVLERARALLATWDAVMSRDSAAGALYIAWRRAGSGHTEREAIEADLRAAIALLEREQGSDWGQWRWGRLNARSFPHPVLSEFDLQTVERGGGAGTVAANGATYRQIIDLSDWDRSTATSTPGQSGQPESPFYGNLLPLWAEDQYFPLLFTRKAVEEKARHRLTLKP